MCKSTLCCLVCIYVAPSGAKVYECGLQGMHSPLKGGRIPDIYVVIPWVIQKT